MIKGFLYGVLVGAGAVWVLRDSIATGIDARTQAVRARTAEKLRAAADAIEGGLTGAADDTRPRIARIS